MNPSCSLLPARAVLQRSCPSSCFPSIQGCASARPWHFGVVMSALNGYRVQSPEARWLSQEQNASWYRTHDMRHTFIARLAENPNVSEQTIRALAVHVSRQMLERYSHIRSEAKQAAIQALEHPSIEPILQATGHKIGHSDASRDSST